MYALARTITANVLPQVLEGFAKLGLVCVGAALALFAFDVFKMTVWRGAEARVVERVVSCVLQEENGPARVFPCAQFDAMKAIHDRVLRRDRVVVEFRDAAGAWRRDVAGAHLVAEDVRAGDVVAWRYAPGAPGLAEPAPTAHWLWLQALVAAVGLLMWCAVRLAAHGLVHLGLPREMVGLSAPKRQAFSAAK